jgi:hypothetical protein
MIIDDMPKTYLQRFFVYFQNANLSEDNYYVGPIYYFTSLSAHLTKTTVGVSDTLRRAYSKMTHR